MGLTDAYATAAEYRAAVSMNDTSKDAAILTHLTAVSRYLEHRMNRFFNQDDSVQARLYYTHKELNLIEIEVDDISTKTGLIVVVDTDQDGSFADETALTIDTDFECHPLNAEFGPEPQPWTSIRITSWSDTWRYFSPNTKVRVTAKYGWPAVPGPIKQATIQLTAIYRMESPRASNRIMEGLAAILGTSPAAQRIVDDLSMHYRRTPIV